MVRLLIGAEKHLIILCNSRVVCPNVFLFDAFSCLIVMYVLGLGEWLTLKCAIWECLGHANTK